MRHTAIALQDDRISDDLAGRATREVISDDRISDDHISDDLAGRAGRRGRGRAARRGEAALRRGQTDRPLISDDHISDDLISDLISDDLISDPDPVIAP